jgi:hypothetical protein
MLQNATRFEQQNAIDRLVAGDTDEQAAKAAGFAESIEKKSSAKWKVKTGKLSFSLFVSFWSAPVASGRYTPRCLFRRVVATKTGHEPDSRGVAPGYDIAPLRGNAPRCRRVLILFQFRFRLRFEKQRHYLSSGALAFGPAKSRDRAELRFFENSRKCLITTEVVGGGLSALRRDWRHPSTVRSSGAN